MWQSSFVILYKYCMTGSSHSVPGPPASASAAAAAEHSAREAGVVATAGGWPSSCNTAAAPVEARYCSSWRGERPYKQEISIVHTKTTINQLSLEYNMQQKGSRPEGQQMPLYVQTFS